MDENRNLPATTSDGTTDTGQTATTTPQAHFATLTDRFSAVNVIVGYRVSAGETVEAEDPFGFSKQEVTVDADSWFFSGEVIPVTQFDELCEEGSLTVTPLGTVRRLPLPGVEVKPIRKGETYRDNLGNEETAPRDGHLFFVSKAELIGTGAEQDDPPAASDETGIVGMLSGVVSDMMSGLAEEMADGYVFVSDELFQLYFGEGDAPEGIILVQRGEPFQAATLPGDITLASANKGDHPVKAGSVARADDEEPDGIVIVPAPMFIAEYAPLA